MSISRRPLIASSAALAVAGCNKKPPAFTFAVSSPVWWNPVPIVAERRAALKNKGFDLKTLSLESGAKVRQAVASGATAMGVASTNAFTTASDAELQNLRILASITHTSAMVAILARIAEPGELMKGRIGYTPGTMSELYLIAFLQKSLQIELYSRKELLLVPLDPPGIVAAFQRGDIDVAVTWEPYASQIAAGTVFMTPSISNVGQTDGEGADAVAGPPAAPVSAQAPAEIRDQSLYAQNIFVFASTSALQTQKPQVDAALAGLKATCEWIGANRIQAARELEAVFRDQRISIAANPLWNTVAVEFNPSQTMIHEALLRDHQLGVLAGIGRATMNGLSVLTI